MSKYVTTIRSIKRNAFRSLRAHNKICLTFLALLGYLIISLFSMLPVVSSCTNTLAYGPSDHTAGLIRNYTLNSSSPVFGFSAMTNFPTGEGLGSAADATNIIPTTIFWLSSKVAGPVCGHNLTVEIGILFSALSMFLFILWLTKESLASFVGGLIFAFNPYMQIKPHVHINYAYIGIFVLIVWALLLFIKKPSVKRGAILSAAFAASWYINGYFILLSSSLILGFFLAIGLLRLTSSNFGSELLKFKRNLRPLLISFLILLVFLAPVIIFNIKNTKEVNTFLNASRGNIQQEATALSARPLEYLLPSDGHPLFGDLTRKLSDGPIRGSNMFEYNVFLGWINLSLALYFIAVTLKGKGMANHHFAVESKILCVILSTTGLLALSLSMPPHLTIASISIPSPSLFIIEHFDYWRVFSRYFILIILSVTVLAMCGLAVILRGKSSLYRGVLVTIIVGAVLFEFLSFWPQRSAWKYTDAPSVYAFLSTKNNVTALAEYPINEPPFPPSSLILSYQTIHKKPLLNSYLPHSPQSNLRSTIADLTNVESVRILRGIGISHVVLHSKNNPQNLSNELKLIARAYDKTDKQSVFVYELTRGSSAAYALAARWGTQELDRVAGFPNHYYLASKKVIFEFLPMRRFVNIKPQHIKLQLSSSNPAHVRITQKESVLWEDDVMGTRDLRIATTSTEQLEFQISSDKDSPLQIRGVGVY